MTDFINLELNIPPPGKGCHPALLGAANTCVNAGLTDEDAFYHIRGSIPSGDRDVRDQEIIDAIERARRDSGRPYHHSQTFHMTVPSEAGTIDWGAVRDHHIKAGAGATPDKLWELSPHQGEQPQGADAALAVLNLYNPSEYLFLGSKYDRAVKRVADWRAIIERTRQAAWPYIISNPFDGLQHPTTGGKPSCRCDAAIAAFRYVLVEFDSLPKSEQLAFWYSIITNGLLPVAVLLDSGGKSIHAWLKVDLPDRQAWNDEIKRQYYGKFGAFTQMGADPANSNPSRLSRLAGHYRAEKKAYQTLLYLDEGVSA